MPMHVFCRRMFRAVHRHPAVHMIEAVKERPHLGRDHEHQLEVTIWARVDPGSSRQVDLLNMQAALDKLVTGKVIPFGTASFEHIALWVANELGAEFPTLSKVVIDAETVEGAELTLEEPPSEPKRA